MSRRPERLRALIMAGGRGQRMRASGGERPKPLMPVRGVPLLERNLYALLGAGFTDIAIAAPASLPVIGEFVSGRGALLARTAGARLSLQQETDPLGTIGAAALVSNEANTLLVVNADNLTALDLRAFLAAHDDTEADLTVASHEHPLVLPYAELALDGTRVIGYAEKPTKQFRVSSAVYALGRRAIDELRPGERCDAPDLARRLIARGARVHAYPHAAPWIDVNDVGGIRAAEMLLARHADVFDCWHRAPDVHVVGCVLVRNDEVLLEYRPESARCYAGQWDTPGGKIEPGETPSDAIVRELEEELGLVLADVRPATRFDDVDATSGMVFRHHVFTAAVRETATAREGQILAWHPRWSIADLSHVCTAALRSVAALEAR